MSVRSFFSDEECRQVGFSEPMVQTLRKIAEFVQAQLTIEEHETVIAPLEALTTTGLLVRTGENAYTTRAVTGTADQIEVADGDGVAGAPTLNLADTAVTPDTYGDSTHVAQVTVDQQGRLTLAADVAIDLPREWAMTFTGDTDGYIPADEAMTIDAGNAMIGTATLAYAKSTTAAPGTFTSTTLPATLQAGAWLKVSATGVTGFAAAHFTRTA